MLVEGSPAYIYNFSNPNNRMMKGTATNMMTVVNAYKALLISVTLNMVKKIWISNIAPHNKGHLLRRHKTDCSAHDRKSCFSVPSSECEVQTRSLLEGWLFERVVDQSSFVRLEDLPSTTAEQHIPLAKPVLQAPTHPLIDWFWICKRMVPENRDLISWWDKTPSSSPKYATMTVTQAKIQN